jgi:alkylated DNA repair dioxygenase AlkB
LKATLEKGLTAGLTTGLNEELGFGFISPDQRTATLNGIEMVSLAIDGAEIYYERSFLSPEEATTLFHTLLSKCSWERRRTSFKTAVPRDEAYYGDPGTSYTYSRREYKPLVWIPELLALKARVEEITPESAYANLNLPKVGYNAALCNLYRDGNDSVGLHSDAEPEMGPVIASVSMGAERLFRLKRPTGDVAFAERLPHGSLLIMAGKTQTNFKHEVPKEPRVTQARINLTFRRIDHR